MEAQIFGISPEHHVLPFDAQAVAEVHLGQIPATGGAGYLVLPQPALLDEARQGPQSAPATDGVVAGAGILRLQLDQLLPFGQEGLGVGNLAGGCLQLGSHLIPAKLHQVGEGKGETLSAAGPGAQIQIGLNGSNAVIPGGSALGIPQPALEEVFHQGPCGERRQPIGKGEVGRLAVTLEGFGEGKGGHEGLQPFGWRWGGVHESIALLHGGQKLRGQAFGLKLGPGGFWINGQLDEGLVGIAKKPVLGDGGCELRLPEHPRPFSELGGVLGEQGVVPSLIELALFSRCRGEGNPGLSEEAKQAGPLAADPPDQTGDAELLK